MAQTSKATRRNLLVRTVSKNFCRENNKASSDDISRSNEKNWTKETYEDVDKNKKKLHNSEFKIE